MYLCFVKLFLIVTKYIIGCCGNFNTYNNMNTYSAEYTNMDKYFRSPFRFKKVVNEQREVSYQPISSTPASTGCKFMDMVFEAINNGTASEKQLATKLGLNTMKCLHTVETLTGYTVRKLALRRKMFLVHQLMQYSSMTLTQVARYCNLSSVSFMCRAFRRTYNKTPYRVRLRAKREGTIGAYLLDI